MLLKQHMDFDSSSDYHENQPCIHYVETLPSVLHEMAWLQHVKHEVYIHEMTCISEVAKLDLLVILCPAYRYNQICKRSSRDLESARNNWKRVGMCTTSLWNCRSVNYNSESL